MKKRKHTHACHHSASSSLLNQQPGTCFLPVEIVRLEDNSYHMIIRVEINGLQGDFIVDTGASVSVIDRNLPALQASEKATACLQSSSVSGEIEDVKIIETQSLRIGGICFKNMSMAAIDLEHVNNMYHHHLHRKVIGLLGCDFCVKYQVIIDYRKKILICRK